MRSFIRRLAAAQSGATAVEYGLIVALIFVVAIGAIGMVAERTVGMWQRVSDTVVNAM